MHYDDGYVVYVVVVECMLHCVSYTIAIQCTVSSILAKFTALWCLSENTAEYIAVRYINHSNSMCSVTYCLSESSSVYSAT